MNGKSFVRWVMALGLIIGLWVVPAGAQNNPPVVSNVTAAQRDDGSKLVDVTYDLDDADGDSCTVWAVVSDNAGVTFRVPAFTFSGDVGPSITPGNGRQIVWDAGADIPGAILTSAVVRVYADDGNGPAPMVVVEGGYFEMGDSFGEGNTDELPVHTVWVSTFLIDKHEVTNAFYAQFLNAGGNDDHWDANQHINRSGDKGNYYYLAEPGYEDHPVVYVSWDDATAFCDWRSAAEGFPLGTYRLPTEAEWEKAAGWDPILYRQFRFGEHTDGCGYNCLDGQRANYAGSGDPFGSGTTPVGYYDGTDHDGAYQTQNAPSYYEAYDMSGDVWEWCYDWYSSTYYGSSDPSDPTGPESGSSRVVRGGSWAHSPQDCRSANRFVDSPGNRVAFTGFRVASGTP